MIDTFRLGENSSAMMADHLGVTTALLIGAGLSAAGSVASSKIQSNAAKTASQQQQTAADQAAARLQPYTAAGLPATNALSYLMGLQPQGSQLPANGTGSSSVFPGGVGSVQGNAAGIVMRAPDGSQKLIPASDVDHYKQLGATVIDDKTYMGPTGMNPSRLMSPTNVAGARGY